MALTDNIVAYWKLDESSGNASDATGNGNTITNSNVTYTTGKISNGGVFTSSADRLAVAYNNFNFERTDACSFSVWMKKNSLSQNGMIVTHQNGTGSPNFAGYSMYTLDTGKLRIDWSGSSNVLSFDSSSPVYSVDTWVHIVLTKSTASNVAGFTLYINGSPVSKSTSSDSLSSSIQSTKNFQVGNRDGSTFDLDGMLDEVGVWSRELTSGEVTELYNGGMGLQYPFPSLVKGGTLSMMGV